MKIGVLALQGGYQKHLQTLDRIKIEHQTVRLPVELNTIDALILPGGESTTIIKLILSFGLFDSLQNFAKTKPIFGTCAGAIILADKVNLFDFPTLKLLDIEVERNAYGTQINSFYDHFDFNHKKVEAMFIRAPKILKVGQNSQILASHQDLPILVRNKSHLVCTCHPELTDETTIHQYFVEEFVKPNKTNSQ